MSERQLPPAGARVKLAPGKRAPANGATTLVERAQRLAEKYLESALPSRFRHTAAVADRAQQLASRLLAPERAEVVVASAWLHDIGYAEELINTGFHPIDGAQFLADDQGFEPLIGLVAHHTGAAFEAHERGLGDQLAKYPVPDITDLAVLSCADLCAGPDGTSVDPADRIQEVLTRYGPGHPVHRAIDRSAPLLVTQAELVLAAAEAITVVPQVFPLPDWVERLDPFSPHWDATWSRCRHRITATRLSGDDVEHVVDISLTDPMDLGPADAEAMADDLRAASAAAAGKPLHWAQYRAFSTPAGAPVPNRRGSMATEGPWVSATFRLDEILEFQREMASEGRVTTVDQRAVTTLSDVTDWTELLVGGRRHPYWLCHSHVESTDQGPGPFGDRNESD